MVFRLFAFAMFVLPAALSGAQSAPKAELILPKVPVAGLTAKAIVRLTFAPGLHGYQNPPTKDYMIPVKVEAAAKGYKAVPKYPKGEVHEIAGEEAAVYEGTVDIPVIITVPKGTKAVQIGLTVSYQQCTKEACYSPDTIKLNGKLTFKRAAKP